MSNRQNGFWRLQHCDLAALLKAPITWETARVFLAIGDLTQGYGKDRDTVSIDHISELTGVDRRHVGRAIRRLKELGLYGEKKVSTRRVKRWIVWPKIPESDSAPCGAKDSAEEGAIEDSQAGIPVSAPCGAKDSAEVGALQEKKPEKQKKKLAAPPPDRAALNRRASFRDVFKDIYHVRLDLDYAPGPSAAGDNAKLKRLVPSVDDGPALREWMRRTGLMIDHLQAEFTWKLKQPATTEAVRDQVAALASIKYLCSNWQRFGVPVVARKQTYAPKHVIPKAISVSDCTRDFGKATA